MNNLRFMNHSISKILLGFVLFGFLSLFFLAQACSLEELGRLKITSFKAIKENNQIKRKFGESVASYFFEDRFKNPIPFGFNGKYEGDKGIDLLYEFKPRITLDNNILKFAKSIYAIAHEAKYREEGEKNAACEQTTADWVKSVGNKLKENGDKNLGKLLLDKTEKGKLLITASVVDGKGNFVFYYNKGVFNSDNKKKVLTLFKNRLKENMKWQTAWNQYKK